MRWYAYNRGSHSEVFVMKKYRDSGLAALLGTITAVLAYDSFPYGNWEFNAIVSAVCFVAAIILLRFPRKKN